jgi:hypothetical protein
MSLRKFRKLLIVALVAGAGYWIYRTRPTVSEFVDDLTRPLFGTKAVVDESEHKREVAEAAPAVGGDEDLHIGMLREKMTSSEVRDLIGAPDETQKFRDEEGAERVRWIYRRLGRVLVLKDGRVVSIAVR